MAYIVLNVDASTASDVVADFVVKYLLVSEGW